MKLNSIFFFFCFWGTQFSFSDSFIQFTEPVEKFLNKIASKDTIGWDIHCIEDKRLIHKLFKKDRFENAPIYAKVLLENKNGILIDCRDKLLVLELLHRIQSIFLTYLKKFNMTYEDVRYLEKQFRETMQLIDPLYH